jgi:hypothetical protein
MSLKGGIIKELHGGRKVKTRGVVVVGGNGEGDATNQYDVPLGLFFDRRGHMYVADCNKNRVQLFKLENN